MTIETMSASQAVDPTTVRLLSLLSLPLQSITINNAVTGITASFHTANAVGVELGIAKFRAFVRTACAV